MNSNDLDNIRIIGETKEIMSSSNNSVYQIAFPLNSMRDWDSDGRTVVTRDEDEEEEGKKKKKHMNPLMTYLSSKEFTTDDKPKEELPTVEKDRAFFDCHKSMCGLDITTYVIRGLGERNLIVAVDFNKEWPEEFYAGYPTMTIFMDLNSIRSKTDLKIDVKTKGPYSAKIVQPKGKKTLKIEGITLLEKLRSWETQIIFSGFDQDLKEIFPQHMKLWIEFEKDPIRTQLSFCYINDFRLVRMDEAKTEVICTIPLKNVPGLKVNVKRKCLLERMEFGLSVFPKQITKMVFPDAI
jgi:hypothetical protein